MTGARFFLESISAGKGGALTGQPLCHAAALQQLLRVRGSFFSSRCLLVLAQKCLGSSSQQLHVHPTVNQPGGLSWGGLWEQGNFPQGRKMQRVVLR